MPARTALSTHGDCKSLIQAMHRPCTLPAPATLHGAVQPSVEVQSKIFSGARTLDLLLPHRVTTLRI